MAFTVIGYDSKSGKCIVKQSGGCNRFVGHRSMEECESVCGVVHKVSLIMNPP